MNLEFLKKEFFVGKGLNSGLISRLLRPLSGLEVDFFDLARELKLSGDLALKELKLMVW
jgi:hypothetical protein